MTAKEAKAKIQELTDQIDHHNDLYYQKNKPQISDYDFDQLLASLVALENEFPELRLPDSPTQRVGGGITKEFTTVIHQFKKLETFPSEANTNVRL